MSQATTGAVVCAKSLQQVRRMNQLFRNREVQKVYLALVRPAKTLGDSGTLTKPLMRLGTGGVRLHDGGDREPIEATTAWEKLATSVSARGLVPVMLAHRYLRTRCRTVRRPRQPSQVRAEDGSQAPDPCTRSLRPQR